ncbi:MAG: three-Cys-motif partner protein TcmP [Planctomycetota bacterium]
MGSDAEANEDRIVATEDGLVLPTVCPWAKRKYHFLSRFLDIFTTAMRSKFERLVFVDLFAAAGFARIRDTDEIVETSSVIAANLRFPFSQIVALELDDKNAAALRERLSRRQQPQPPVIINGDTNDRIGDATALVQGNRVLCVTLADPFSLAALRFETLEVLSTIHSDLVVLLPDGMDAIRNMRTYYNDNPNSSLDEFMGESGWRELIQEPQRDTHEALRLRFEDRLRQIGYKHFDMTRFVNPGGQRMYSLVFASRHELGLKFWREANKVDEHGQRELFSFD